jgi:hypothetical protein
MNPTAESRAAAERKMDRRLIRIEFPPAHAGITAALRHAFAAVNGPVQDEFEELLRRLD